MSAVAGRWLIARTLTGARYPCRCRMDGQCRGPHNTAHKAYWCPCWGRPDAAHMHGRCCARRAYDTAQRQNSQDSQKENE